MIYFTSDLHFWHKNSIVYTNRPFETVEKMNEKLIEYWNKTVHANDEVYILGDVTMVRPGRATEIISQLKGRKYLLMGNHDYFAREKQFEPAACGIEWVKMYHELHSSQEYNLLNRDKGRRQFDVGVDANDFKPVSLEAIVTFFEGTV